MIGLMNTYDDPMVLKCPQCGADLMPGNSEYIICQYCGSSLLWHKQAQGEQRNEYVVLRGMRLKQFTYKDQEGTGLELFNMLAPDGWQMQGGCRWVLWITLECLLRFPYSCITRTEWKLSKFCRI
jgi:DNA-directed RNA polymerase subunit RPC12/RpoP